jgi:hypothetical protein
MIRNTWTTVSQREARHHLSFFADAADNPASAGTPRQRLEITGIGATLTLARLVELGALQTIQPISIGELKLQLDASKNGIALEERLRNLFDAYGSDKGSPHGYSMLYAWLLNEVDLKSEFRILEIGLGTNRTSVPSNMGPGGRPGASLRAWRDMGNSFEIVGLDIDREILTQEERISTHYIDQLNSQTWSLLPESLMQGGFDLVIDDGLHAPLANLNSIIATLPFLRRNGLMVIEDVPKRALPVWTLAKHISHESLDVSVYQLNYAYCVVIRRKD